MGLALSILLLLAGVGILFRAWFSPIAPFNIVLVAIRQTFVFLRRQWAVALFAVVPTIAAPFGAPVAINLASSLPSRLAILLAWQFACVAAMALVAIRVHRGLIKRERVNRLLLGRREARMVGFVLLALALITAVRYIPTLLDGVVQGLPFRAMKAGLEITVWGLTVALCFVGPAASLDDETPFRTSVSAAYGHAFAAAALVIFLQGLNALGSLAISAVLSLTGINLALLMTASLVLTVLLVFTFIVAEHALVIALTRIRENVYEPNTRDRDHNADWV